MTDLSDQEPSQICSILSQPATFILLVLVLGVPLLPESFSEGTKRLRICALQCAMCRCLQKATAMRADAIFFLLHCGAKLENCDLIVVCFSLSCNPGAINR